MIKKLLFHLYMQYTISSIGIFYLLFSLYEPVTLGFSTENMLFLGACTIGGLLLFQYILGPSLFNRAYIAHGIIGLLWALTFPIQFKYSYSKPFYFYQFSSDFLSGLLLFMILCIGQYLFTKGTRKIALGAILFTIFDMILLIIPGTEWAYFAHVQHCFTPASLMALYQTNPQEAMEYLVNGAGYMGVVVGAIGLVILAVLFYLCNKRLFKEIERYEQASYKKYVLPISFVIGLLYTTMVVIPHVNIISDWLGVNQYMKQLQAYSDKHKAVFDDIKLNQKETAKDKAPGTIILVIGESASRSYMKAYNPKATYDNTPWESEERNSNNNFIFFDHVYTSYVQTVPSLERALTERNQYDDKPFLDSATIVDIAKKAGYKTYWFSNQGLFGEYDTPVSLIAKGSDHAQWDHEAYEFTDKYDGALLPLLKQVNPNENNFIILHIMGSHIYYNDRYPSEFSKFKKTNPPSGLEAYSNSILYTDHILKEIYTYGKDHLHLQAMVYFSDHGESIDKSHNPDVFNFVMARIPMWIYLSPTYQNAYPETYDTLRSHAKQYYTNDLLYDMLVGIMQAQSNRYDPTRDFSNKKYRFTRDTLTTLLGQYKLSEDPNEE